MDENLKTQVQARLEELPENVRRAITAADLDARIQAIGKKHNLHIDKMDKLEDETLLVMLAFSEPAEFTENLVKQLGVSKEQAEAIATDIGTEIFTPIRTSMQEFVEERNLLETIASKPATPPAAATSTKPAEIAPAPPTSSATPAPKPLLPPAHPGELALTQKTVTTPPPQAKPENSELAPPKPTGYKTDPYREPPEL